VVTTLENLLNINRIRTVMKNKIAIPVFLVLVLVTALISCKEKKEDDPNLNENEKVNQLLTSAGLWSVQSVTVDGSDQTSLYKDVKLSFTTSAYTTLNGGVTWPASGTWKFADDSGRSIVRDNSLPMTINEIGEKKLVLSFTWSKATLGSGRATAIAGQHIFTFTKP
jgi:hypothetical protein